MGNAVITRIHPLAEEVWTFDDVEMNSDFLISKMRIAISIRRNLLLLNSFNTACRLIHAESDGIPGLIVDQYGDFLAVQFLTAGIERWR